MKSNKMAVNNASEPTAQKSRLEKGVDIFILTYIALPIAIWLTFWMKWYVAIPSLGLLFYGVFCCFKNEKDLLPGKKEQFSLKIWIPLFVLAALWALFSGIGAMSFQNVDFEGRNAIFNDLVNFKWPVKFDYTNDPQFFSKFGERGLFNYYFAFWIPAALIGKAFGMAAGNFALYIWTVMGVLITFYLINKFLGKASIIIAVIFVFFSGMDIIGYLFMYGTKIHDAFSASSLGNHLFISHKEWWSGIFQYSSFSTQLYWVFNQTLPAWIIILLMLNSKNTKCIVFTAVLMIPYGPLPFIGCIFLLIYSLIFGTDNFNLNQKSKIPKLSFSIKEAITIPNLLCILFVLPIGLLYTLNTEASYKGLIFERAGALTKDGFLMFLLWFTFFCLLEYGFYMMFIKKYVNRHLFFVTSLFLALIPLFYLGRGNDFCMRASVPFLLVVFLLVVHVLFEACKTKNKFVTTALIIMLFIGSFTSGSEIYRSVHNTFKQLSTGNKNFEYGSWKTFSRSDDSKSKIYIVNNYVSPYTGETFIEKYIIK